MEVFGFRIKLPIEWLYTGGSYSDSKKRLMYHLYTEDVPLNSIFEVWGAKWHIEDFTVKRVRRTSLLFLNKKNFLFLYIFE